MLKLRRQPGIPPEAEQPSSMFAVFCIAPQILSLMCWSLNTQGHSTPKAFLITVVTPQVSSSGYAFVCHKLAVNE